MAVNIDRQFVTGHGEPEGWLGVQELISRVIDQFGTKTALVCGGDAWTFQELDTRANAVAARLSELGVKRGDLVGLFGERRLETLAGLMGILRCGAAYVPLDPAFPSERLEIIVRDTDLRVVAGWSGQQRLLKSDAEFLALDQSLPEAAGFVPAVSHPEDRVYVIYTSGSTGQPKGVSIPQRAVVNFVKSMAREPGLSADDVVLALTTFSFDMSKLEIFLPLTTGATMVIASDDMRRDGLKLAAELTRTGVTVMQATPGTWRMLRETGWEGNPRLKILTGAEPVPRALVNDLVGRCASLWTLYGPTETTVWSTVCRLEAGEGPVPIGRAIDNTSLHVVDEALNPVPEGEPGELLIGGEGVALGYHRHPELTAEKFLPDADRPGRKLYRTGDIVRWKDGLLEFVSRADQQVKIRGYRVELGEIESRIEAVPGVRQAVAVVRNDLPGTARLVAYVAGKADFQAIRTRLRECLPDYMIPSAFVAVDSFPLNFNGKVDRAKLVALPFEEQRMVGTPPVTERERAIHQIWSEALGHSAFGCDENFFELGGDSIQLAIVHAKVIKRTGRNIAVTELFAHPTVRSLAASLDNGNEDRQGDIRARADKRRQALAARLEVSRR